MSEKALNWFVDHWKEEWRAGPLYVNVPVSYAKRFGLWWPDSIAVWWGSRGVLAGWNPRLFVGRLP